MGISNVAIWITIMEYLGSIAFAASGALVAMKKHMDIFGVIVLGLTTATAGGVLRDLILDVVPPSMFRNPTYAFAAMITSVVLFLKPVRNIVNNPGPTYDRIMFLADTIGLAVFTVVGVRTAIAVMPSAGLFLQVFIGVVSAVGGGVLRDVMAGVPAYIFTKHVYAVASAAGALVCGLLWRFGSLWAMLAGFLVVFIIRCMASHYKWNLPRC